MTTSSDCSSGSTGWPALADAAPGNELNVPDTTAGASRKTVTRFGSRTLASPGLAFAIHFDAITHIELTCILTGFSSRYVLVTTATTTSPHRLPSTASAYVQRLRSAGGRVADRPLHRFVGRQAAMFQADGESESNGNPRIRRARLRSPGLPPGLPPLQRQESLRPRRFRHSCLLG